MKIYLACPYSHNNPEVELTRFRAANKVAADIMCQGHVVFSPISHSHSIHIQCSLPGNWEFWLKQDTAFIEWCDEVWVMKLDGWTTSKGIKKECEIARELGKIIRLI